MTQDTIQYPDDFIARLEIVWGEGFLSPGGADEVREIVAGLELRGRALLDIGCGTGGVERVLAGELGAGPVTGIDVEPQLLALARRRTAAAGLDGRVTLRLVEPGPLPFADASFEVVFSKDSLIHQGSPRGLPALAGRGIGVS